MSASVNAGSARSAGRFTITANTLVFGLSAATLVLHLFAGRNYGYFVDELYHLACGRHLDWGYVDQPPLIAAIAWGVRVTLGQSLFAIRFLPALAAAIEVALAALIARELGGRRFAQLLTCLSVMIAPGILMIDGLLTMNAFEPLFWLGCAYLFIRIVNGGDQKLWIWIGVLAGLGLENKYSMLIFGAGIVIGMLLTPQRRLFLSPWPWIGGAIAFLLFLPNVLWNIQHHFPFLEMLANTQRGGRNVALSPLTFFIQEAVTLFPLTLPIWLTGLWFFFFSRAGKPYRALGWAWLFTAAVIATLSPRIYYLYPAMPLLFAAGGVAWEDWLQQPKFVLLKIAYLVPMVVLGALAVPFSVPVLSPEAYIRYSNFLNFQPPRIETHKLGPMPQLYADQFGWENMVEKVAGAYNKLPADVRARTAIFAKNYGQAGAIDLLGPKYGLPSAISGHQSYFLWGPRNFTGESIIVLGSDEADLKMHCLSVQKVANVYHPYSMPYEHFDVFHCRGLKQPLKEYWPRVKSWG